MRYTIYNIITVLIVGLGTVTAQDKNINKGNDQYDQYAFIDARKAYLKVAEDGYQSTELLARLGDSYYFTADYENAAKWYAALYNYSDTIDSEYLYRYALSLKSTEQYAASDAIMEKFYAMKGEDYRGKLFVNERNYLQEIEQQSGRFTLEKVDFNSNLSDFAPSFYQNRLVFASNRSDRGTTRRIHDWNEQPFLDLYQVSVVSEDATTTVEKMSKDINSKYHESTAVYTKDGNTLYFTRNNYTNKEYKEDDQGTNKLKLYRATRENDKWTVEELPFNSDQYSVAHPALSEDEKTLYFASDKPGGKGQSDLYKVAIKGTAFGEPENLGDTINTEGRETFPFVSKDNKIYFSSDGHVGLGGLDVFVSTIDNRANVYGEVFNLGRPINSPEDDFTFIINETTGSGYVASNRKGGMGDDDIYSFIQTQKIISTCSQTLEGIVLNVQTNNPIPNAKVLLLDGDTNVLDEIFAKDDGSFAFNLDCNTQYAIRAAKENYTTAEKAFGTTNELNKTLKKTLFLKTGNTLENPIIAPVGADLVKILGLNPIYFDLDKDFIRADAEIELRKVLAILKLYPTMKIDIRSHTDSRADDDYNMDLSNRRAQSTMQFLITNGIDQSRLLGKGYGETRHVNRCSNGVPCAEYEHQLNRRSEFIIIEN